MNGNVFTVYRKFPALTKYIDLITENKDGTFSYCPILLIMKVLNWCILGLYYFIISDFKHCYLRHWLEFHQKSFNDVWLGIETEFQTIPEMACAILLPCCIHICELAFSALAILKLIITENHQNIDHHWKALNTVRILLHQIFTQGSIIYIKINKHK